MGKYDDYCLNYTTELLPSLDADPDGKMNVNCARCRVEEEHDFDEEPLALFSRSGRDTTLVD